MKFIDWEARPAILTDDLVSAWAVLAPGESWTRVDSAEVIDSGALLSEAAWWEMFADDELPPLPLLA